MKKSKKENRLGEERYNEQGCLSKIIEYKDANDIIVQFQDKYKTKIHTKYDSFLKGRIKNPYHPEIYGVGMIGIKYPIRINNEYTKEYRAWLSILWRCFNKKFKKNRPTYQTVICCNKWFLYEDFYEWLHSQKNFDKWFNGDNWAIDKDILIKGNKLYSPETCCLVPQHVNSLFVKTEKTRGNYPVGVNYDKSSNKYRAQCSNLLTGERKHLGLFKTPEQAFQAYKEYKEAIIKQVAQIEYNKGNITQQCKNAMLNYIVEITD